MVHNVLAAAKDAPPATRRDIENRVASLFQSMDAAYEQAAAAFGFVCRGCDDNCCMTRFYHHTVSEFLYIRAGLRHLAPDVREAVRQRAESVCTRSRRLEQQDRPVRLMCPLNVDTRCMLYAWRPMICRLHGIPHRFQTPARTLVAAPGCDDFTRRCSDVRATPLDRTVFYRELAALEKTTRDELGVAGKLKLTIAEMLAVPHDL